MKLFRHIGVATLMIATLVVSACEWETSGVDPDTRSVEQYAEEQKAPFSETGLAEFHEVVGDILAPIPLPEVLPGDYKIRRAVLSDSGIVAKGMSVPVIKLIIATHDVEGWLDSEKFDEVTGAPENRRRVIFDTIGQDAVMLYLYHWNGYQVPSGYHYDCFLPPPDGNYLPRYLPEMSSSEMNTEAIGGSEVYMLDMGGITIAEWRLPDWDASQFIVRSVSGREVSTETFREIIASIEPPEDDNLLPFDPGYYASNKGVFPDPALEKYIRTRMPNIAGPLRPNDLTGIETIDARGLGIVSLDGLEYCTGLKTLKLKDNHISDLSPLAGLTGLNELDLTGNAISNVNALSALASLKKLELGYNRVEDIEPLASLTGLEYLDLGWNEVEDIGPLSRLTGLEHLDLGVNEIPDVMALAPLENLTYLHLSQNRIGNLHPLAGLTKLETLVAGDNQIEDISPLTGLSSLSNLSLYHNRIKGIAPVAELTSLEHLDLRINEISDLTPLAEASLPKLQSLHMECNFIEDATPLTEADLPRLKTLVLRWNRLSEAAIEKAKEALTSRPPSERLEAYEGNHGITTTKVNPEPGDTTLSTSALMIHLSVDDLVEKADAIVTGRVIDIFPVRQLSDSDMFLPLITDVVIEVEEYLYGERQAPYIALYVYGGRIDGLYVWVEDQPEFKLDEEVALFLYTAQPDIPPPDGFQADDYYGVFGSAQGKYGYANGVLHGLAGEHVNISEVRQKIAAIHGVE